MFRLTPAKKRAICYFRHSAEDKQENSIPIQRGHAEKFTAVHNIELIREEADEGVSGLTENRPGFQRLFKDWVLNPEAPEFDYVIVLDVSRWGRFQDPNQAAYYEYLCTKNGKKVIYIDRGFPKEEEQLASNLITNIDRYMAAHYSRQLSDKVFHGSVKVSKDGFSAGGVAPYGLSRLLLDESKKPIGILKKGERKIISNQRVTFIPSKNEETETVNRIFSLLTDGWNTPVEIAGLLNSEGKVSANGQAWNRQKIVKILTNEAYAGSMIYNKTWGRLKQQKRSNPRAEWVICPNAFEAIVSPEQFAEAQEHLYWLMPSKWKRGIYAIQRIKKLLNEQLRLLLAGNEDYTEDDLWKVTNRLPMATGITFYREGKARWCFCVPDNMRKHSSILAVSVDLFQKEPVDKYFLIPTQDFGMANHLVVSEKDEKFSRYALNPETVEDAIRGLCETVAQTA